MGGAFVAEYTVCPIRLEKKTYGTGLCLLLHVTRDATLIRGANICHEKQQNKIYREWRVECWKEFDRLDFTFFWKWKVKVHLSGAFAWDLRALPVFDNNITTGRFVLSYDWMQYSVLPAFWIHLIWAGVRKPILPDRRQTIRPLVTTEINPRKWWNVSSYLAWARIYLSRPVLGVLLFCISILLE